MDSLTSMAHGPSRHKFTKTGEAASWNGFAARSWPPSWGHRLEVAQANCSVSRRGVLRGIHFAETPPGQAKYVTCVSGAVLDVVVDLRVGSPSFGQWTAGSLNDQTRRAVYVAEGLGHGFVTLTDEATVLYLCSAPDAPGREHGVDATRSTLSIGISAGPTRPADDAVRQGRDGSVAAAGPGRGHPAQV